MSKSSLPREAADAAAKGQGVFVCRINQGFFQMSGNTSLYGIAEVIDGIQKAGWRLDQVTWFEDRRDHPSAFCIFQRAGVPPMPPQPQYAQQPYPQQPMPPQGPPPGGYPPPPTTTSWGRQG
jgi:hypothetical protein